MTHSSETASNHPETLREALNQKVGFASSGPGIYLMKDASGKILYVGKARNLKKRLQSYFQKHRPHDPKTTVLLTKVVDFETMLTATEKEAFILEANLIKRHRPRYNVNLKDDKRYPSLKLDLQEPYPNLSVVRKIQNDGARYFGPYSSSVAVRQTLKFIHKTFKLRKCKTTTFLNRSRPCLNYQMGLCLAPCTLDVDPDRYNDIVKEVIAFLSGRTPALIRKMKRRMTVAAAEQDFEAAAELRDKMFALMKTLEKQVTVTTDFKDRDVVGAFTEDTFSVITLMNVRSGILHGIHHYFFENAIGEIEEHMATFLQQYYNKAGHVPAEIAVSHLPENKEWIEEFLSEKKGRQVSLIFGQRGSRAQLIKMAIQNAENELAARKRLLDARFDLLARLQKRLNLSYLPRRIECFDNSNWSGKEPVAAMVVFTDGQPNTDAYRRFKIQCQGKPDDYAYMAEVVRRRYSKEDTDAPFPELLLVDGGRGQLNVALAVLKTLGLSGQFNVAGIAKKDPAKGEHQDKIYLADRSNPVQFGRDTDLLLYLQQIRDEAHRWAVGYQRTRRRISGLQSAFDQIKGVGPRKKALLLKHFGNIENIRNAEEGELTALPGITVVLAKAIKTGLS